MNTEVIDRLRSERNRWMRLAEDRKRFSHVVAPFLGIDDPDADDATKRAVARINAYKDRIQDLYRETIRLKDQLAKEHSDVS